MATRSMASLVASGDAEYVTKFESTAASWRHVVGNVKQAHCIRFVKISSIIILRSKFMLAWDRRTKSQRWRPQAVFNTRVAEDTVQVMVALKRIYKKTIIANIRVITDVLNSIAGTIECLHNTVLRLREGVAEARVHINTLGGITGIRDLYGNCGMITPGNNLRNTQWIHPLVNCAWNEDWYPHLEGVDQLLV